MSLVGRVAPKMATGSGSFSDLSDYLLREGVHAQDEDKEPPLATGVLNCSSVANAAGEMEAAAALGSTRTSPVYHVMLSCEDGEYPSAEQAAEMVRIFAEEMDLSDHQMLWALQNDGKGHKWHVHIMINRVHPENHRAWSQRRMTQDPETGKWRLMNDYERVFDAGAVVEQKMGFRERTFTYGNGPEAGLAEGARKAAYYDQRRAFQARVRDDLAPLVKHALEGPLPSWNQFHALVREHTGGFYGIGREGGGVLTGLEPGERAGAKAYLGYSHADLEKKLGPFVPDHHAGRIFEQRVAGAVRDVEHLRSTEGSTWADVHRAFEARGLEYRSFGGGARVYDLDSAEYKKAADVSRPLRMGEMQKTFGAFESAGDLRDRAAAAEAVRHAEDVARGASILANPSKLVDDLVAHDATFTVQKLQKAIEAKVDDEQLRAQIAEKIIDDAVLLEDKDGKRRFTTRDVIEEERTMRDSLDVLASTRIESVTDANVLREMNDAIVGAQKKFDNASAVFDAFDDLAERSERDAAEHDLVEADDALKLATQTRDAYVYATEAGPRVRQVTGVPGAGKTYLIDKIAEAYANADRDVRGTAVSWQATNELNAATNFSSRAIAKETHEWEEGRDRISDRDVVVWDEISMGGSISGAKVAKEIARTERGVLLQFGDPEQLAAVERGDVMRATAEALEKNGHDRFDMKTTRRQVLDRDDVFGESDWQRRAVEALRAGDVRDGLDAFRKRGLIKIVATDEERRKLAVEDFKKAVAGGERDAVGATYRNVDVAKSNVEAHAAMRELGLLERDDHVVKTAFGERAFAVGERVVVRQKVEDRFRDGNGRMVTGARFDNGDVAKIDRIDGQVLHLRRERDGQRIKMDLSAEDIRGEKINRVDYAYFGTSYRVQGATKETMRGEGSRASNAASTLVDLSRGRTRQTLYLSQESIGGKTADATYDRFVGLASRQQRKEMATDSRFKIVERVKTAQTSTEPKTLTERQAAMRADLERAAQTKTVPTQRPEIEQQRKPQIEM